MHANKFDDQYEGTIIGGLSPRRIRSGPPTSPPEIPPKRTQTDSVDFF